MITLEDRERDVIELDARAARHLATLSQNNRRLPVLLGPFYPRFTRVLLAFYSRLNARPLGQERGCRSGTQFSSRAAAATR
jgi:hypothetical protein